MSRRAAGRCSGTSQGIFPARFHVPTSFGGNLLRGAELWGGGPPGPRQLQKYLEVITSWGFLAGVLVTSVVMHTSYLWVEVLINCCLAIFSPSPWQRSLRASSHLYFLPKVSLTAFLFILHLLELLLFSPDLLLFIFRLLLLSTFNLAPQQLISYTVSQIGRICCGGFSIFGLECGIPAPRVFIPPCQLALWITCFFPLEKPQDPVPISSQSKPDGNHGLNCDSQCEQSSISVQSESLFFIFQAFLLIEYCFIIVSGKSHTNTHSPCFSHKFAFKSEPLLLGPCRELVCFGVQVECKTPWWCTFREKLFSTDRVGRRVTILIQSKADLTAPAGIDWFAVNATDWLSTRSSQTET